MKQEDKHFRMKQEDKHLILLFLILVIVVVRILTLTIINKNSIIEEIKETKLIENATLIGRLQGQQLTYSDLWNRGSQCQTIPLTNNNQTINLIAAECLQRR